MSKRGPSPSTLSDRINALEMRMARMEVDAEHRAQDLAALEARVGKERLARDGQTIELRNELARILEHREVDAKQPDAPWWRRIGLPGF